MVVRPYIVPQHVPLRTRGSRRSEAEETAKYEDLKGALVCLIDDFNLSGVEVSRDTQLEMFT